MTPGPPIVQDLESLLAGDAPRQRKARVLEETPLNRLGGVRHIE